MTIRNGVHIKIFYLLQYIDRKVKEYNRIEQQNIRNELAKNGIIFMESSQKFERVD